MKRTILFFLILTGIAAFPNAQTAGAEPFRQEGIASWYGSEFDGKPTASGEIFNSGLYTAAHPTLPFNTYLTITNKQNNHKVTVRVNDRGPFVAARIIDLSKAAAEVLDMVVTGTAPVIVELTSSTVPGPVGIVPPAEKPAPPRVNPGNTQILPLAAEAPPAREILAETPVPAQVPPPPASVPALQPASAAPAPSILPLPPVPAYVPAAPALIKGDIPPPGSVKLYRLQVGSYTIPRNAVDAFEKLKNAGLNPAYEKNDNYYRVVLARLKAPDIPQIAQILGNAGFREVLVREETD